MNRAVLIALLSGLFSVTTVTPRAVRATEGDRVDFDRDIRPLFSDRCFPCHGPDGKKRQANLRLDIHEGALNLRGDDALLVPGDAQGSKLFRRISADDASDRMPPEDSGLTLSPDEIDLIGRWIQQGASWQGHWSFVAPERSDLPHVDHGDWARNPIDQFILARLEAEGLASSPAAKKTTLIRRLSFDLTGLPPTPEQVEHFLNDGQPDAYERLVDRLLASPAYGERMAMDWMDGARYSDTFGYHEDYHRDMWAWRDWVIRAFNANMPFDQFTIEQLAGDLLDDPTADQTIATGFNRLHGCTSSGIAEEYRVEYVIDRVQTTATVWLGLTLGCAQCHDHKFDPISQREFYRFYAYFNSQNDPAIMPNTAGNVAPMMPVPTSQQQASLTDAGQGIEQLTRQLDDRHAAVQTEFTAWEKERLAELDRQPAPPTGAIAHYPFDQITAESVVNALDDQAGGMIEGKVDTTPGHLGDALRFDGQTHIDLGDQAAFERSDAFSYGCWVYPTGDGAVISRMDDDNDYRGYDVYVSGKKIQIHIIHQWPGNAIHLTSKDEIAMDSWQHLFVTYDGSSKAGGVNLYLDGQEKEAKIGHDSLTGTIKTDKPLHIGRRNPGSYFQGIIDEVRIYPRQLTAAEVALLAGADPIAPILATPSEMRTTEQQDQLRRYYLENHDAPYQQLSADLANRRTEKAEVEKGIATTMVMEEPGEPVDTFILNRGLYDQPGEQVEAGTPACLPAMPPDAPPNRLGVARWLVDAEHPLTSRVTVNRFWQSIFGTGLVKTAEDLGSQGERPSHPALLDWLAAEFVESGWNVKALMKLIVTSATYRQESRISPDAWQSDPENRLLARGSRFRLPAEMIRDNALAISDLLVHEIGGPSVKPYQPAGLWTEAANRPYLQDHGENLYRRSIYTYWRRTIPPANMIAMDAPSRETCIVRRQRTNTPIMALVLMNDPTFVEAARGLAQRVLREQADSPAERIDLAFQFATARRPNPDERKVLLDLYQRQSVRFADDREAAGKLLSVGESKRDETLDAAEHAAWASVASIIMNLDETISKE